MNDCDMIKNSDLFADIPPLFSPLFDGIEYPWELLPRIKDFILRLLSEGAEGYSLLFDGVLVGRDVKIAPTAVIEGTAVVGHGTVLRPGAYLRGGVLIGEGCVIGNSTELKNCIIMNRAQVPHYNYVGDSVLGYKSHMGAGSITSNVKSDKLPVVIHNEGEEIEPGRKKVGAMLGDYVEVGCNSVLNPGTVIGRDASVYPTSCVRGVVPERCIYKAKGNIAVKK